MSITVIELPTKVGTYPKVEVAGLHVTVPKFKGKMGKQEFELLEDEEFTIEFREVDTEYLGYIVRDKDGEVRLLVDEISKNDPPFNFEEEGITRLQFLFGFFLPANSNVITAGRIKTNKAEETDATP